MGPKQDESPEFPEAPPSRVVEACNYCNVPPRTLETVAIVEIGGSLGGFGLASTWFTIAKSRFSFAKTYSQFPSTWFSIAKSRFTIAKTCNQILST